VIDRWPHQPAQVEQALRYVTEDVAEAPLGERWPVGQDRLDMFLGVLASLQAPLDEELFEHRLVEIVGDGPEQVEQECGERAAVATGEAEMDERFLVDGPGGVSV